MILKDRKGGEAQFNRHIKPLVSGLPAVRESREISGNLVLVRECQGI